MTRDFYQSGEYLKKNPTWDVEDSLWKAGKIANILAKHNISPATVCEVGCGAGEILKQLELCMADNIKFFGYEISPQAYELAKQRENERLNFQLKDISDKGDEVNYDVILLIDVIEHIEDYIMFLRRLRKRGRYFILHIPLDISVQSVLRGKPLLHVRKQVGHIHYFTKELAMQILSDLDYDIIEYHYTSAAIDLPARSFLSRIARIPRKLMFSLHKDFAARILGGYSLLVLAK